MAPRVLPVLAALALLSASASAAAGVQAPPSPHVSSSGSAELAPMPATPPIQGTPPDLTQPASVPAWQPPPPDLASPSVPAATGPAPATMSPKPGEKKAEPKRGRLWTEGQPLIARDSKVGAYIAPTFKLTGFGRSPGLMLGADFAVIVNERFMFGAAGTALATPLPAQRTDDRTFNMRTQYAGVTLAVALLQVRFFSLQIGALIGGGRVCLNDERLDRCVNRAAMFVAEPELGLSFALTRVLRLVLSGGYRFAVAQPWSGPSDRILSGLTGTLGLRLGKF
ncbi:hypothetical protein SAMN02745121_03636 [Nannocystis exedens]|uniref:Outer membrane protein beta-barrel domain-containing protein n=1 Tax=Nannocystis exedens TaxID=54 RepID=A0A1I1Z4Q5_9BACT|nr:hypothetical protein [Nannocystis exedens]PCC75156.1 hypothetical protein NAEX_08262 [Nannocystis exedens]SFE26834.1 hypothetical protein SAMN02745121_03636 [Nannocystis exedens]